MPSLTHSIESVYIPLICTADILARAQAWLRHPSTVLIIEKTHPPFTILLATKWCQGWLTTASPGASDWKWEGATTPSSLVAIASGKSLRAAFQASALTGGKDFLRFVALPGSKVRESTLWWLLLSSQG